jgi:microcystin-dependent protein
VSDRDCTQYGARGKSLFDLPDLKESTCLQSGGAGFVEQAWPAAKNRILNRQAARLLLQLSAANSRRALSPSAKAAST